MNMLIHDRLIRWNSRYADAAGRIAYWQERNKTSYDSRKRRRAANTS